MPGGMIDFMAAVFSGGRYTVALLSDSLPASYTSLPGLLELLWFNQELQINTRHMHGCQECGLGQPVSDGCMVRRVSADAAAAAIHSPAAGGTTNSRSGCPTGTPDSQLDNPGKLAKRNRLNDAEHDTIAHNLQGGCEASPCAAPRAPKARPRPGAGPPWAAHLHAWAAPPQAAPLPSPAAPAPRAPAVEEPSPAADSH